MKRVTFFFKLGVILVLLFNLTPKAHALTCSRLLDIADQLQHPPVPTLAVGENLSRLEYRSIRAHARSHDTRDGLIQGPSRAEQSLEHKINQAKDDPSSPFYQMQNNQQTVDRILDATIANPKALHLIVMGSSTTTTYDWYADPVSGIVTVVNKKIGEFVHFEILSPEVRARQELRMKELQVLNISSLQLSEWILPYFEFDAKKAREYKLKMMSNAFTLLRIFDRSELAPASRALTKSLLWESISNAITHVEPTVWNNRFYRGSDGSYVFYGAGGFNLVIDPTGKIFRGKWTPLSSDTFWPADYTGYRLIEL